MAEQEDVEALSIEQVDALTGDDMAYWLSNPFMTPDMLAGKVCWWVSLARADRLAPPTTTRDDRETGAST